MEQIKINNALKILINAARIAAKRGTFSLAEAKIIAGAVEVFVPEDGKSELKENTAAPKVGEKGPAATPSKKAKKKSAKKAGAK